MGGPKIDTSVGVTAPYSYNHINGRQTMNFNPLTWLQKTETEVKDVEQEVTSIVTGPVVSELTTVINKIIENANNPIVLAGLQSVGVNAVEVAGIVKSLQVVLTLVSKVETVVQAQAAATTTTVTPVATK